MEVTSIAVFIVVVAAVVCYALLLDSRRAAWRLILGIFIVVFGTAVIYHLVH